MKEQLEEKMENTIASTWNTLTENRFCGEKEKKVAKNREKVEKPVEQPKK